MLENKAENAAEKNDPVIAAVRFHAESQMIDTLIIVARREVRAQMKIAGIDVIPHLNQINKAAVRRANRRDRAFIRPGIALPGGVAVCAGAFHDRRALTDAQRHGAEGNPVTLVKMVGPAVRLGVDYHPRPAVAPEGDPF